MPNEHTGHFNKINQKYARVHLTIHVLQMLSSGCHISVTLILASDKLPLKLTVAKLITLHVFLYDFIQSSTN